MKNFHPSYFFDLASFQHKKIFDQCEFVWQALEKIDSYLKSLSLGKIEGEVSSQAFLINPEHIYIGKGTTVEPGAYIKGPCYIGQNCTIRHGAYIRGGVLIGNNCVIGHDTEVKNSIFLNDAHAAHFAYVGDSILGNKINLGAGVKCANLKLDGGKISIMVDSQRVETGLRKMGAIVGDETQLGCNSVTNPGTLLGKGVQCYPCTNFGGFVPANSRIKPETKTCISPIKKKS